jgi:hypothetical protein
MNKIQVATILLVALSLTGCVTPVALEKQAPTAEYVPSGTVAIAVVDQRERVLKGGKPPTFIGKAHGAFGIPADWHVKPVLSTEEGDKERTLAEFIQHRLMTGLGRSGWSVVSTDLSGDHGTLNPSATLQASGAGHLLMLVLKEWYFSLNLNWVTAFNFDTEVDVIVASSHSGDTLRKTIKDRDVIDEEAKQSPQNLILQAYRGQLLQILMDADVKDALMIDGLGRIAPSEQKEFLTPTTDNSDSNQPAPSSYIEELKALVTLRDDGIITEEEFQKQKSKILENE